MKRKYLTVITALILSSLIGGGAKASETGAEAPAQSSGMQAAVATLSGTVTDADGEPLIGASVMVEGSKIGASTDIDGKFSIANVKVGSKFTVSYVGYSPVTKVWNGKPMTIILSENTSMLDEVVVVGYGVQKKVNLTGAVSEVKGAELALHPVGDAAQQLQGLVPGLFVSNTNSGRPGGSASLQLRGQGNLSGTGTPYVLVDGVEMDLADVNPNDIESISVLKDAGASAIYGARAAYGVILVTTKRGQDGNMRVSYQGTVGWSKPTKLPEMVDGYEFAKFWNAGCTNAGTTRLYSDEKLELLKKFRDDPSSVDPWFEMNPNSMMNPQFENSESGVGNTDYFDLHYKDWAFKTNHNLSMSGGGKKATYYISLGYYSEDGVLRYADMGYKRYNFATNIRSELTKWLTVRANTKFVHNDTDTPFGTGGLSEGFYHSLARFRPTVHPIDPNGHFTELSLVPYLQSGTYTDTKRDRFAITAGADINPLKDWYIFVDYTYKYNAMNYEAKNIAPDIYAADGERTSKGVRGEMGVQRDGSYTRRKADTRYQNFNIYTNYSLTIADVHNFSIMAGYQSEESRYSLLGARVTGLYSTTNPGINLGSGATTNEDTRNSWSTRGYYGRFNYNYDGRYLIEFNARYDGSSRFASNNRWGFFPSVSVGWNIAKEKFWEDFTNIMPQFKLRGSWGKLGNQSGAALYTFASTMGVASQGNYWFGDDRTGYIGTPGVIDPNVTWEKVESKNIGVDFGFLNMALTGSFELFQRDTHDMLGPGNDFPDFFGADAPQANNASMRNRGWEFQVNYNGRIGKDINFSIGGSISDATAEVTEYENPTGNNPGGSWYTGRKVGEIWGLRSGGILQTQEAVDAFNSLDRSYLNGGTWTIGDVSYIDINNDGKINRGTNKLGDMGDFTVIGNTTPRYQYTINGSIGWKGLNLRLMFQGVGKRDWNPGTAPYFWGWSSYAQATVFTQHLDYWTPENTDAYYPKPYMHTAGGIGIYQNRNMQTSDRYLQNAAYIRLKNVTLSYDLPKSIVSHVGLDKVQVFFTGENLWTSTKLAKMYDPEAIFTSNTYTGEGGKNYPMNKVISFGLIVNL